MIKTNELFDRWNNVKKKIEFSKQYDLKVKNRQFWLYRIWVNLWNEESKDKEFIRPCIIINQHFKWDLVLIAPLTTKCNKFLKNILVEIDWKKYWLDKTSFIVLNQFKVISKKRLVRKLNDRFHEWVHYPLFDNELFLEIIEKIKNLI